VRGYGITIEEKRLLGELKRHRMALERLVSQLDAVHNDSRYAAVWEMYAIHGNEYSGPFYKDELAAAKRVLDR
jgi:hypothetical protein